jgi:hypothetical protein
MDALEALLNTTILFTLVFALSFVIERLLEILKALYYLLDSRLNWYKFWDVRTKSLKDRLEKRMRIFEYVDPKTVQSVLQRFRGMFLNSKADYTGTLPVLSGDLVRSFSIKVGLKVIGMLVGIGLAFWFEIDLLGIWREAVSPDSIWAINITSPSLSYALSGIVMGLGTAPVHKIITTIERRQEQRRKEGV